MNDVWSRVKDTLRQRSIPIDVVIELTRKCNLNCFHCYNIKDDSWLSFDQVRDIAGQLRKAGTLFISLTGGEVFTHPDFFDIGFFLKESGFDLKLFTNGTLIDESNIGKIEKLYLSEVGISIQGADAQTHDKITGIEGSFVKAIEAVKLLKARDIAVNIKTTLMQDNFTEHEKIAELAGALGAYHIVDPVISPKDDGSKQVLVNRLGEAQLKEFYRSRAGTFADDEDGFKCPAGSVMAAISAKGDVYPCIQLPEKLGNVFEKGFIDIWTDSLFLKKLRTRDKPDQCAGCGLFDYCMLCPGLAYLEDGDAFGRSAVACLNAGINKQIIRETEHAQ